MNHQNWTSTNNWLLCNQQDPKDEPLNIKVMGHDQSVVQFKIKPHTNFAKLMKIYCERMVSTGDF